MTENHVTREEFNGAIGGLRSDVTELKSGMSEVRKDLAKTNGTLTALEAQYALLPKLVIAELSQDQKEANKWKIGQVVIPSLTAALGILATLLATIQR